MASAPTSLDAGRCVRHGHRSVLVGTLALVLVAIATALMYAVASNTSSSDNTVQGSGVQVSDSRTVPAFRSVDLAGSINVVIRVGEPRSVLDATVSGSGQAELDGVDARVVQAVVSGSGEIVVTAVESLDASVPGSGSIVYTGEPTSVTKSVTGSGDIVP